MWRFTEFHDEYRRKGWKQSDFASGVGYVTNLSLSLFYEWVDIDFPPDFSSLEYFFYINWLVLGYLCLWGGSFTVDKCCGGWICIGPVSISSYLRVSHNSLLWGVCKRQKSLTLCWCWVIAETDQCVNHVCMCCVCTEHNEGKFLPLMV